MCYVQHMSSLKHILLLATGGTIACKRTDAGLTPVITSQELLSYVPAAKKFCKVHTIQLMNIDSTNMQSEHWLSIAAAIEKNYDAYDGFVITHGTDTMAYTASALSYLVQNSAKPVIITGAQKPIDMDVTDARTNLLDSLRVASDDRAYGVNIVFDGKLIAGTRGKKERTHSYNAFSSINFPYLASVQDDRCIFYINDKNQQTESVRFYHTLNDKVTLLKLIPSMNASILDYMAGQYDAVIIESFGVGGLPSYASGDFYNAIARCTELGKTVVMTTQVTREGSNMTVYEVGRSIKKNFGLIEAYDMTLEATVTKLMWILGQTKDAEEINRLFYTTINRDILWS
jgi:L-asparaginase